MVSLLPVSGLDDSHRDLFAGYVEVYAASGRALFGDEHTAWGADELREMERSPHRRTLAAAAVQPDGEVVGSVSVVLRTRENPRVAFLSLAVHPDHGRRGVGSLLLRWAETRAVEHGRSVFIAETEWPAGGTDVSGETFARGHGYAPASASCAAPSPCPSTARCSRAWGRAVVTQALPTTSWRPASTAYRTRGWRTGPSCSGG